ncbi:MAG: hypothetical protein AAFQ51_07805 [Pseudomonadota bacterium]
MGVIRTAPARDQRYAAQRIVERIDQMRGRVPPLEALDTFAQYLCLRIDSLHNEDNARDGSRQADRLARSWATSDAFAELESEVFAHFAKIKVGDSDPDLFAQIMDTGGYVQGSSGRFAARHRTATSYHAQLARAFRIVRKRRWVGVIADGVGTGRGVMMFNRALESGLDHRGLSTLEPPATYLVTERDPMLARFTWIQLSLSGIPALVMEGTLGALRGAGDTMTRRETPASQAFRDAHFADGDVDFEIDLILPPQTD